MLEIKIKTICTRNEESCTFVFWDYSFAIKDIKPICQLFFFSLWNVDAQVTLGFYSTFFIFIFSIFKVWILRNINSVFFLHEYCFTTYSWSVSFNILFLSSLIQANISSLNQRTNMQTFRVHWRSLKHGLWIKKC